MSMRTTRYACLHVLYVVVALTSICISAAAGINQQIVICNNGTTVPTISIASNTMYSLSNCTFSVRFVMPTGVANASVAAIGGSALPSIFIDDNASVSDINISVTNVVSDARSSPREGILWTNADFTISPNLTVSRLVLEVSNCRIAYSANGKLFYLSMNVVLQLSFRLWNTTIEANFVTDGNNQFSVTEMRLTDGGALHFASMTVLNSTIVIFVTRCTVVASFCYSSPLVAAILFLSSTAGRINNLNITVMNTATSIQLLNTDNASFMTQVDLVAIGGTTRAPSQFHGVAVTVENSTANMTGNEVVVVSFVKCGALNDVAVTVRNVTLVGKMIECQSIGTNKGAILGATISVSCSFFSIVISHVAMTMAIQVAPLEVVSVTSLASLVAIASPNISSTHVQIHDASVAMSVANVVPSSLPASSFSTPIMRFSIVLLQKAMSNESSLQQTTVLVDRTHLDVSVPALTASATANTFMLMEHSLICCDVPSVAALQMNITSSTLNSLLLAKWFSSAFFTLKR